MPINQYHLRIDRLFPKFNFNLGIHENISLISNDNTNILRGYDGMMSLLNGREGENLR